MNIVHIQKGDVKTMTFSELKVGQKASVQKTFTAADVTAFAGISLDVNPIHMSDAYAKDTIFGKNRAKTHVATDEKFFATNRIRNKN